MGETYSVMYYNELDAGFGYDAGPQRYMDGLDRNVANSIARHMNRVSPDFIDYYVLADYEAERAMMI